MSEGNKWMLEETREEMVAAGFVAEIMPGPLLIATTGGKYPKMKTMALAVGSTFKPTKELLVMGCDGLFERKDNQEKWRHRQNSTSMGNLIGN